jgi:hypothetical protein
MGEGFLAGTHGVKPTMKMPLQRYPHPEPVACAERSGPTPIHPEPGRETL